MKRKIAALLTLFLCILPLLSLCVSAAPTDDYPYYIKDFDVQMTANPDRSVEVVETLQVFFNEERRGIIRTIPYEGDAEGYRITDVSVEGVPFAMEEGYKDLSIRIGDPDVTITGDQQYVIRYTLRHYADYVEEFDYLYLNVIGTQWDTIIQHVSAQVTLPADGQLNEYTVTSGRQGSTSSGNVTARLEEGVIHLETTSPLQPEEGITLNAEFLPGAFPEAEEWQPPYVVNDLASVVTMDRYGGYIRKDTITVTFNEDSYLWLALSGHRPEKVKLLSLTHSEGISASMEGSTLSLSSSEPLGTACRIEVEFSVQLPNDSSPGGDELILTVWPGLDQADIESIDFKLIAPFPIASYTTDVGRYNDEEANQRISIEGGSTEDGLALAIPNGLKTSEAFAVNMQFPEGTFAKRFNPLEVVFPLLGAGMLLVVLYLAFFYRREKPLTPPIEFYPPGDLNPAELGYVIDGEVSPRDVTSLIFYWASQGYLDIEIGKSKEFTLHYKNPISPSRPAYEQRMFDAIWSVGKGESVKSSELKEKFYREVNAARSGVVSSFRGDRTMRQSAATLRSVLMCIASLALLVGSIVLAHVVGYPNPERASLSVIFGVLLLVCACILVGNYQARRYKRHGFTGVLQWIITGALAAIAVQLLAQAMSACQDISYFSSRMGSILLSAAAVLSPMMSRRTEYGVSILERTIGFKNFLKTAEKSRLEMLLEENPNYYYDILPYAQVLGVTNLWTKKFDGLLSEPPSWCYGENPNTMITAYLLMNALNNVNRTLNSVPPPPPSSGGGGGFSGGGGGFSGGGFSGGGSGGGGGSSW